jgi:hypothetical protein
MRWLSSASQVRPKQVLQVIHAVVGDFRENLVDSWGLSSDTSIVRATRLSLNRVLYEATVTLSRTQLQKMSYLS